MIDRGFWNLVLYGSGLLRSQPLCSWPKPRGSARKLVGGESPVDGNFDHGPGNLRFGCTGGGTALKVAPYLRRTHPVQGVSVTAVRWGGGVAGVVRTTSRSQRV